MNYYDLTNPQKSIWMMEEYYKGTNINNICAALVIKQNVDFSKLNKAVNVCVQNNKSFGLNFKEENGKVVQYFTAQEDQDFDIINFKDYKEAQDFAKDLTNQTFNIYGEKLYKFFLYRLENGFGGVILLTHHIVSDAATFGLIATEIMDNYSKILENIEIEKKEYSYEDYIQEEQDYMNSPKFEKDASYWNNLYASIPEVASIPSMLPKKNTNLLGKAKRKEYLLEKELLNQISEFCKRNRISSFNFFMAIYSLYLGKISNLKDFVIGTPILNRSNFKEKHTTGMFINTAPLRINIKNDENFIDFVKRISGDSLSMLRYQKYPYEMLLKNLRKKESDLPNLFDVMLSYQITKAHDRSIKVPYEVEWFESTTISNGIYIHLHDNNDEESLDIAYDYQIEKYEEKDIVNMHNRILCIINQVLENENVLNHDIEIVTPEEKSMILNEFNDTFLSYDHNKTLIDYFEEQVEKTPDNIAIVFHGESLTYSELNKHVNCLARYLRSQNIVNNSIVGVMLNRSFEMIISILAVLKAGGAYIPIDPDYPDDRISYMLSQSKSPVLISGKHLESKIQNMNFAGDIIYADLNENPIYSLEDSNLEKISKPDDLSYIIYTSGSTGTPKGVMLMQKNLSNFVASMFDKIDYLNDNKPHSIVSITTVSFDIFAFETLVSLCSGLKLFMTDELEQKATIKLEELLLNNNIEIIQSTPSVMNFHLENSSINGFSKLKYVMLAGEQLPKQLVDKIKNVSPNVTVYDGYGPSETTIFSAVYDVTNLENITIGKPIANTWVYILGEDFSLLPPNTLGEIYIAGDGVGRGYLGRDDLTEKSYFPNPFKDDTIMYKSGDLGLWNKNGILECMGRADHQVKLRGLRIELGEIEECINSFDLSANIKSAVIIKEINNRSALNAFISSSISIDINELKNFLFARLPRYMMPNTYTFIDKLPFTPNGKIDRKALLKYEIDTYRKIDAPKNDVTKYLVEELKNSLKSNDISISDSFFEIGGDSLIAIKLCSKISSKYNISFNVQDIFEHPIIKDISDIIISKTNESVTNALKKTEEKDFYHLSSAQKRIYYSSKMAGDNSCLYNVPGAIVFNEKPNIRKLNECFEKLIEKHSSLRTYFEEIDGEVYQKVLPHLDFKIEELSDDEKNIDSLIQDFVKPFDLSKAPLLRACLVSQKHKYILLFDIHHIICDGTSLTIFTNELSNLYNGNASSELKFTYADYSEWEFSQIKNHKLNNHKEFWVNEFKDNLPVLDFQTDYVRPNVQSFEGSKINKTIDSTLAQKISNLAKNLNVSNFMLLISIYYVLLFKYSNQEDIVVGTPTACRDREELWDIIGMFVNTLPLKNHIDSNLSFKEFLYKVKTNCTKAFSHQLYPFDELVNDLNIERDTSRSPLFDTAFIYQNNGFDSIAFSGINSNIYIPNSEISKFDFSLEVIPKNSGEFDLNFEYCTKLFKKETIERFAEYFISIVNKIIENSDIKISDIDILSEEEKYQILHEFNNTGTDYPKDKTIIELFEEQVEKTPDNIAVVFEDKKLTYRELNEKANCLAWHLREIGVKRNDIVSIMVNRSLELLISIIAVLKSGACYIPIDPNYPKDRTEYMLKTSNSKLLLTSNSLYNTIDFEDKIIVDLTDDYFTNKNDNLPNINIPEDASYIIYTSGSTGIPKGVVLKHQSLTNLAYFLNSYVCFFRNDEYISMASVTTASFDIFIFETLMCLQNGLKVVIANEEEQRLPSKLNTFIMDNDIKAIQMTPSRMRIFVDNIQDCPNLSNLDYVVLAGEPLPDKLLKNLLALGIKKVYNGYGPSETTVFSTFTDVTDYKKVNIGKPLANTQMYILDKNLTPVPIGMPGELYIAGDGVGKGYLNNEEITKDRFIINPFNKNSLMYKTGDCCKFLDNGEIAYIERLDNQVKIRGLRIELEEIEAKLLEIPDIKKAKVVKQTMNNRDFISAYYVGDNDLSIKDLRIILSNSLPNYMIPSYFTKLEEFPYTPNGKIDKKSLPLPTILENKDDASYIAPRSSIEVTLAQILKNIFNISNISMSDNFYNLGGDSLTTITLCTNVKQKLNVDLSFRTVMENPIIEELANIIANAPSITPEASIIKKCALQDFYPTTSSQKRTYLASLMEENSTLYNISGGILLNSTPDLDKLQNALDTIVSRHEPLRTHFEIINKQIVQKISEDIKININIQDVNTNNPDELFYIYESTFDLSKAPLFNVTLFKLPNGKTLIMLDIHHIIFDGTSLNNFIQELSDIYNGNELSKLDISYKDFAVWENGMLNSNGFDTAKNFWKQKLAGNIPVLNLPTSFARPSKKSYEGAIYTNSLSKDFEEKINNFANKYNLTPYMVMLSAYYVLLNKYTDSEDIIVGSPASGRLYRELEPLLGMFVNSIPLRNTITSDMKFDELLQNVKTTCIDSFSYQDYPFDLLVNDLKLPKDPSRSLLFDTMFIYQNNGIKSVDFEDINGEYISHNTNTSKFDISLEVLPSDDKLTLSFEYCTKLFDEIFIGNFAKAYENILNTILDNPNIAIGNISIMGKAEKNSDLYKFNKIDLDDKENINSFEAQADTTKFTFEENPNSTLNVINDQTNNNKNPISSSNVFSSFTNENGYDTILDEIYSQNYIAPRNPIEVQVATAFQDLLSIPHVGIDDNFFELGGDSLVAINLQIELMKSNLKLTYADIFSSPTVRTLSEKISLSETASFGLSDTSNSVEFDKILSNSTKMPDEIDFKEMGNVLITGTTGFLGAHILENFLKNESGKAYCAVRPGKSITPIEKFKEKLHYYFGEKYDSLIGNRIIIVNADISKNNLGLSPENLEKIAQDITCVINSAAKVAHFRRLF